MPAAESAGKRLVDVLRHTPPLVLPMLVLSVGLVTAGSVAVRGIRTAADTITVTGASTERITSDYVDWTVEVRGNGSSQQEAYQALQPQVQRTLDFLKAQKVPEEAIELGVIQSSSEDVRNRVTGALITTRWTTRQPILIGTKDVNLIHNVSRQIADLVGQGCLLYTSDAADE